MRKSCHARKKSAISNNLLLIGTFLLFSFACRSSDTILVDLIHVTQNIKTIASDSTGTIWISGGLGLQYWDGERFIVKESNYDKFILEYEGKIIDADEYPLPKKYFFPWEWFYQWKSHLPGNHHHISAATDHNKRVWVATGTNIFIFQIEDRFVKQLEGYSIRGIYVEGEDTYVNTYSGIMKNEKLIAECPEAAEGKISKIEQSLLIAWDGLLKLDLEDDLQIRYMVSYKGKIADFHEELDIYLAEKIQDTIWVGSNQGLGYIAQDTIYFVSDPIAIEDIAYYDGKFLIASQSGIWEKRGSTIHLIGLPDRSCHQILYKDRLFYFPTDAGIYIWDGIDFRTIGYKEGLSHNITYATLFDNEGFLWASTFSGLNRIDLKSGIITHYLHNIEFNKRSYHKSEDKLFFGGMVGLFSFNPTDFIGDENVQEGSSSIFNPVIYTFTVLLFIGIMFFFKIRNKKLIMEKEDQLASLKKKNLLLKAENFIFNHSDLPGLSVSHLAEHMKMSERSLYRICTDFGLKPGELLKDTKLKKGMAIIQSNNGESYKEIAKQIGYSEQYFLKLYKKKFGVNLR
jgi:AraC-like DNA-binding protein/ligand-binding sensor domain-containing protein